MKIGKRFAQSTPANVDVLSNQPAFSSYDSGNMQNPRLNLDYQPTNISTSTTPKYGRLEESEPSRDSTNQPTKQLRGQNLPVDYKFPAAISNEYGASSDLHRSSQGTGMTPQPEYSYWQGPTFHNSPFATRDSEDSGYLGDRSNSHSANDPHSTPPNKDGRMTQTPNFPTGFERTQSIFPNTSPSHQPNLPFSVCPYPFSDAPAPTKQSSPPEPQIKSPTFNGKTNFLDFIVQFECVAVIKKWSDEDKGARLLMALEGQAASILPTLPAKERMNYDTLRAALEKRYNPKPDADLAGGVAQTRRRKKGESYIMFAQELKRLMHSAYENWSSDQIERLTRERFFNAIEDTQLKGFLWSRAPRSVEEAAMMADGLEKLIESPSDRPSQAIYANKEGARNNKDSSEKPYRPNRNNQQGANARDNSSRTPRPPVRQGNYRQPLRQESQQPARRNDQGRNQFLPRQGPPRGSANNQRYPLARSGSDQNQRGPTQGPRSGDMCYFCQRPGHWAKHCMQNPNRIRNDSNNRSLNDAPRDQSEN